MKNLRINKCLAATLTSVALVTTSLVGCTGESHLGAFKYKTTETGEIKCASTVSYDVFKGCEVVELTSFDKKDIFLAKKYTYVGDEMVYINVVNGLEIYSSYDNNTNKSLENFGKVDDYLLYYDKVKAKYNAEDMKELLNKIEEDRKLEKDKTLVKN